MKRFLIVLCALLIAGCSSQGFALAARLASLRFSLGTFFHRSTSRTIPASTVFKKQATPPAPLTIDLVMR